MGAKHVRDDDKSEPGKGGLFTGFGARIARSLFFWGLAAILASSAYTGIVRIARERPRPQDEQTAAAADGTEGAVETAAAVVLTGEHTDAASGNPAAAEGGEPGQEEQQAEFREPGQEERQAESREPGQEERQAESREPGQEERQTEFREQKRVALTFDDGPHPLYTEELLDGLKERGVKATFFVVGENIPGNEDIIRRMDREGHLIGNHTYDHVKISDLNTEDACEQIEKTSALVRELTGKDTEFVRPPFGEWKKDLECSFVMIPVLWDVDPRDWATNNASDVVRRVLEDTKDGDIILLHDYYKSSVKAALCIVDALQEQGYEFVTVDELILE